MDIKNHLTENFFKFKLFDSQEHFSPYYKSMNPVKINCLHVSFKRDSVARQSWKKTHNSIPH